MSLRQPPSRGQHQRPGRAGSAVFREGSGQVRIVDIMKTLAPWPYPRWIAHRGAGRLAPENTLAALRLGAAHGYRMFECDVKLSADDVPFLMHDATLERTTSGRGIGGDLRWSALSQLDAGVLQPITSRPDDG